MSKPPNASKTFKVAHRELGDAPEVPAGVISIDGDHRLHVISAEPAFADLLGLAAATLNGSDTFMVRARPPANAKPLTLHKRRVARTDADAGAALVELLWKNYGLVLTPAA